MDWIRGAPIRAGFYLLRTKDGQEFEAWVYCEPATVIPIYTVVGSNETSYADNIEAFKPLEEKG